MYRTLWRSTLVAALASPLLGGCGIYVGNIRFTAVELCSEEYASRLHPSTGCLPPARAENVQSFLLTRYRMPISPFETRTLTGWTPDTGRSGNFLPSILGRVFEPTNASDDAQRQVWRAPTTGDIEFISMGDSAAPPQAGLNTEVLVSTDLSGIVEKKIAASVDFNPAIVVDAALGASGIASGALPSGLRDALTQVVRAGYQRHSVDIAKGSYYYASLRSADLDGLMTAFADCNWSIAQDPQKQKARSADTRAVASLADGTPPVVDCAKKLAGDKSIPRNVLPLIAAIEATRAQRPGFKVAGVVVGAAIIHTARGSSELCSSADIGTIQSGATRALSTMECEALRSLLEQYKSGGAGQADLKDAQGKPAGALSDAQSKTLVIALSAGYARSTYKALDIQPHTSVLAIHWVPIRVAP